jgi:hypothetical protein
VFEDAVQLNNMYTKCWQQTHTSPGNVIVASGVISVPLHRDVVLVSTTAVPPPPDVHGELLYIAKVVVDTNPGLSGLVSSHGAVNPVDVKLVNFS